MGAARRADTGESRPSRLTLLPCGEGQGFPPSASLEIALSVGGAGAGRLHSLGDRRPGCGVSAGEPQGRGRDERAGDAVTGIGSGSSLWWRGRFRVYLSAATAVACSVGFLAGDVGAGTRAISFRGDYETGDYSQWGSLQYEFDRPLSESFAIVTDPVREGRYAAQFTVRHGYSPFGWDESTEVARGFSDQGAGTEYYYAFSVLFPEGWTDPKGWALVVQFYTKTFPVFQGPPPVSIDAGARALRMHVATGLSPVASGSPVRREYKRSFLIAPTLNPGRWNDFLLHVRWAADRSGFLHLWHRVGSGWWRRSVWAEGIPTLRYNPAFNGGAADPIGLIKEGLYRQSFCRVPVQINCAGGPSRQTGVQPPSVVFHDGFRRGDALAEVVPDLVEKPG